MMFSRILKLFQKKKFIPVVYYTPEGALYMIEKYMETPELISGKVFLGRIVSEIKIDDTKSKFLNNKSGIAWNLQSAKVEIVTQIGRRIIHFSSYSPSLTVNDLVSIRYDGSFDNDYHFGELLAKMTGGYNQNKRGWEPEWILNIID